MRHGGQHRKYGFACSNCRRRKARCNGAFPTCARCAASKESCNYDKGPSVAYAISLQNQLKAYEERFESLRRANSEERIAILNDAPSPSQPSRDTRALSSATYDSAHRTPNGGGGGGGENPDDVRSAPHHESPDETSVGLDGRVCFYGKTSLYHVEPQDDAAGGQDPRDQARRYGQFSASNMASNISSTCAASDISPSADNHELSVLLEVPTELLHELLEVYWCWPHHLHLILCKPLFLRDLYMSGPFVTSFLLCAVLAQAARYSTRPDAAQISQEFADKALQLLPREIDKGSSIPTIQGLLIYSARECACGRTSQGWLYSGMAFRMMRDIGIHIDPKRLGHLARQFTEEEIAMRQQIFWGCYTWDKTISLCLGRVSIIHDTIQLPTTESLLAGREANEEVWRPVCDQRSPSEDLVQQKALGGLRFAAYCELCIIIDCILDTLYSRPHCSPEEHLLDYLKETCLKLESWSSNLADDLFIKPTSKTLLCPPLHILLLNLQYHTTVILLCRPFRTISHHAKTLCTEAARMIDNLFTLHVRRFRFRFVTYLQTYTMFVACTINILDYKENSAKSKSNPSASDESLLLAQEASARLDFGLEVLRQASSTPSAGRCAAIISRLLQERGVSNAVGNNNAAEQDNRPSSMVTLKSQSTDISLTGGLRGPESSTAEVARRASRQETNPQDPVLLSGSQALPFAGADNITSNNGANPQRFLPQSDSLPAAAASTDHPRYGDKQDLTGVYPTPGDFPLSGTIETPIRWLPENMEDDGSWMLMADTDLDFTSRSITNF